MKILILNILVCTWSFAAISNYPLTYTGVDQDQLDCTISFNYDEIHEEVKAIINGDEFFFITEADLLKKEPKNKIIKILAKTSALRGPRELIIYKKPNNKIQYKVKQIDKIDYESETYLCNQLKLTEK